MSNKSLIYSLIALVAGTTMIGGFAINRTAAQPQMLGKPPHSSMGMMMNREEADSHFIEMMIPHHQGAIDMANLAMTKAKHPEIKTLAESIKKAQTQEIEEMTAWYKQWYGIEVPAMSSHGMGMPMNSDRNRMEMGMMEHHTMAIDLDTLKNAPDFDKAFIEQMIPHHKMAVMMAAMILDSNRPEMRQLAKNIIQTQSAEIEEMREWKQDWYQ
ncbi:MAG TPA: DUF305 domain-containing protein [Cyanobacteria bacterium UBA11149]|nr:DUF305 domain-containing protein [Cyanobacteria bacterium UBA11367]HBE59214.1 DUF305 domain-containing protein [Cyanobacteria bacterium UBA11366]HBK63675.1 DUF305 domain-containing protein [Cyanobacteria bacterium UBA11166]HBR72963.1 DUF305 domain-containing protein [Cyanobacteria bacterium UBA11159]HBS69107.1 DUF305 domain-containing protein [Cyanobacteria bacterium UBA11153]HBW90745.1 DUF305 domain-containing protein [Cyanobacteria bacterium UBA11149]HCA97460.1 DUF305 domain-containing p